MMPEKFPRVDALRLELASERGIVPARRYESRTCRALRVPPKFPGAVSASSSPALIRPADSALEPGPPMSYRELPAAADRPSANAVGQVRRKAVRVWVLADAANYHRHDVASTDPPIIYELYAILTLSKISVKYDCDAVTSALAVISTNTVSS